MFSSPPLNDMLKFSGWPHVTPWRISKSTDRQRPTSHKRRKRENRPKPERRHMPQQATDDVKTTPTHYIGNTRRAKTLAHSPTTRALYTEKGYSTSARADDANHTKAWSRRRARRARRRRRSPLEPARRPRATQRPRSGARAGRARGGWWRHWRKCASSRKLEAPFAFKVSMIH